MDRLRDGQAARWTGCEMDDSTRSFRRQPSKLGRAPAHDVLAKRLFRGSLLARLLRMIYLNAGVFVLE